MSVRVVARLCAAALSVCWVPCLRAQGQGLPPEWEVRKDLDALVERTRRLKPLLDAVKPADWVQKGAPAAYQSQLKSVLDESDYLVRSAGELAREPERLTLALETYFRMQSRDALLASLDEGVARYQNPALADLLRGAVAEGATAGEKLRQYVVELAALKEGQLRVADQEAQRCRSILLQQPARKQSGSPR